MAVKFSIPNYPSLTSTKPNLDGILFVPDLKKIISFISGNLDDGLQDGVTGFSDIMTKKMIVNNLKLCKTVDDFEMYRDLNNISLPNDPSSYFKDGVISLKSSDIKLPLKDNYSGMKAFERTIIQSLLETQKPYMEIYKGVAESMVKIEDIIACVLAVSGRSLKPKFNPRALSYKNNKNILLGSLKSMDKLSKLTPNINKNSTVSDISNTNISTRINQETSTEYSTGDYEPTTNYDYSYEYYNESKIEINTTYDDTIIDTNEKPPVVIFGIYNSKGIQLLDTEIPKWVTDSGKWYGQFDRIGNYTYKWINGKATVMSKDQPKGNGWKKETYNTDTIINGFTFTKGDAIIYQTGSVNQDLYKNFFNYELKKELSTLNLSAEDVVNIERDIDEKMYSGNPSNLKLMIDLLVENNYLKGYDGVSIPLEKSAFVAKEIQYDSKTMYIDPETEYDLKIIKVDTNNYIQYWDVVDKKIMESQLMTYDLSGMEIKFDNKSNNKSNIKNIFSAEVYNGNNIIKRYYNTEVIFIQNPLDTDNYKIVITELNGVVFNQTVKLDKKPGKSERVVYTLKKDVISPQNTKGNTSVATPSINIKPSITTIKNVTNTVMVLDKNGIQSKIGIEFILNNKLITNNPYSDGIYGEDVDYTIEKIIRYPEYNGDVETYYIVEGILEMTNDNYANIDIIGTGGKSGRGYYKIKDVIKAFRKFISLIIHLATKIFPPINKTLALLTNPTKLPQFILEILTNKLGDDMGTGNVKFKLFSSKFSAEINKIVSVASNVKNNTTDALTDKKKKIETHIKESYVRDYFYVTEDLDVKCLLDGKSLTELFGITLGVGVTNYIPKLYFYKNPSSKLNNTTITEAYPNGYGNIANLSYLKDSLLVKNLSSIVSKNVNTKISVVYSTGDYIDGVNYDYTYVSESISNTINIGDELESNGDITGALKMYEKGIISDPSNNVLERKYADTISKSGKDYLYELGLNNPLMDLALGMITTPIKLIKEVIDYILHFFKSLGNPFSLLGSITDFISFSWFQDFLKKEGIMKLLGIKINIKNLNTLMNSVEDVDMSKVVSIPFLSNIPKFSPKMFSDINQNSLIKMFISIFEVIENTINMLIDLLWAIMGLAPLFKKRPYLNLSKDLPPTFNGSITDYMVDMILGNSNEFIKGDVNATTLLQSFVYDIQISDGRTLRDLNRQELDLWISENENLEIVLNF